jgi:hypothetical protein
VADAYHYPTYYFDLQAHIAVPQYNGTYLSDLCSAAGQDIWFAFNTPAMPVLTALEPPCSLRQTHTYSQDPNFNGSLPAGGPVFPSPYPGKLQWTYPFQNPDGTIKPSAGAVPRLIPPATNP